MIEEHHSFGWRETPSWSPIKHQYVLGQLIM